MIDTLQHADYCDKNHKSGKYLCSEEKEWREDVRDRNRRFDAGMRRWKWSILPWYLKLLCKIGYHRWSWMLQKGKDGIITEPLTGKIPDRAECYRCGIKYNLIIPPKQ
ncbi:MAG: hypothetical protein HY376_01885 [Candidatus Blackburnbacteria bacterium]|nr:hypothetical protein [Candidatus Blackburnbacteria bacterium]